MNASKKPSKRKQPGRPRELRLSCNIKGIIQEPSQNSDQFEEKIGNDSVLMELIFQFPLHLKCISNTIRQIDKNGNIEFCFLPDSVIIYYGDSSTANKCFLRLTCQHVQQYYFNFPQQGFIKFSIPVGHVANTFNFYNRSSVKTEIRIFGPQKPVMRIDSFKSEKRKLQKITNTINIRLSPCIDDLQTVDGFLLHEMDMSRTMQTMAENFAGSKNKMYTQQQLREMNQLDRMIYVLRNPKLFNECFFLRYSPNKVYSFCLANQDIRKFITEVQKDCQSLQIIRELIIRDTQPELKQITLKSFIPGSGSQKKLENSASQITNYRVYNQVQDELNYSISSNILKQISSNNAHCIIQFIMLSSGCVVLKIRDQGSSCIFKFLISNCQ